MYENISNYRIFKSKKILLNENYPKYSNYYFISV